MTIDLPPPQRTPAAWTGAQMASEAARAAWTWCLSPAELDELDAATRAASAGGVDLARMRRTDFPLPTLAARLERLRIELLDGRGFALLRGVPIERYSRAEAATLFMGVGAHLGHARSQNAKGHVLGHVCDLGLSSADPNVRIYQTRERQTFHTDSCDVVGLLCLREAQRGGDSLLVSALALYNEMHARRPDLLARLLRPMAHDRRGEVPAGQLPFFMIPVFSWFAGRLTVFYQRQYFDSAQRFAAAPRLAAEDVEALDLFDALANDPRLHLAMRLAPGDLQSVHNHTMLHAARYGSLEIGDRGGIVVPGTRLNAPLEPA
jgi:hypothetical protein